MELLIKKDLQSLDNHTLISAIHKWTYFDFTACLIITIVILLILTISIHRWKNPIEKNYLIIGLIPLISCTSNNFYVLTIPLFFIVLKTFKSANFWTKTLIVFSALLMGGNIYEIWGRAGVDAIDQRSPYVLSTLLAYVLIMVQKKKDE